MTVSHKEVTLETDSLKTEYICSARNSYGVYNITIIVEAQCEYGSVSSYLLIHIIVFSALISHCRL